MRLTRGFTQIGLATLVASAAHAQGPSCSAPQVTVELAPHLADSTKLFRGQFSPDGRELYYFKKVTPGQEDYRIFVSQLRNGAWSEPEKLLIAGEVSELYPTITPDGRRLVFSSYQPVPGDTSSHPNAHLYVAERRGNGWGAPVLQRAASRIGWYHSGPVCGVPSQFSPTSCWCSHRPGREVGQLRPISTPAFVKPVDGATHGRSAPG
jgi:hypothetical protein